MRLRTLIVTLVALAVVGSIALAAFRFSQSASAPEKDGTPVAQVRRGSVAMTVTAEGELQGGNPESLLAPAVAQDTLTITFIRRPGELVNEGDMVVEFDTTQQEYNLREAEADLAEAQQRVIQTEADNAAGDEESSYSLVAAKNRVELAALEIRKNKLLPANTARDNEIALEAARNRLRQAEQDFSGKKTTAAAGLAIQKAAEARARLMAEMARKNIESMSLKAKTRGYVNLQPDTYNTFYLTRGMTFPSLQIGSNVRPGMVVAQIPDLDSWEVSAMVSELDRGHLSVGQPVSVSVVALAGKTFPGRVKLIGNATGQGWDRKFECRIGLDSAGPDLRPGMSSGIVITAATLQNVLWVPSQAVFERDGRSFVYLKTPNGYSPRDITLVRRSESQVVITGVDEGAFVALSNPSERNEPAAGKQTAMKALAK